MSRLKDKIYNYFVRRNGRVWYEYERYVKEHINEHKKKRAKHMLILLKLNWFYRVKKGNVPYLYPDTPLKPNESVSALAKPVQGGIVPFMAGSESSKRKWTNEYKLAQRLMKYDVISFDIFDTLILRSVNDPKDIFTIVSGKFQNSFYYDVRIKAEKEARDIKSKTYGTNEVNIFEIYDRVKYYIGNKADEMLSAEFETELDFCHCNPYLKKVVEILKNMGKTIIATSDMYYPRAYVKELLLNCGYEEFADILVSCDCNRSKANKDIWLHIRDKFGQEKSYVHIGDVWTNDVVGARENSFDALHYVACRNLGNPHRCVGMSLQIESVYRAIINNELHNGKHIYTPLWEYGFIYGGIAAIGYASWIHRKALENKNSIILFLARDGYVFKNVFDMMFHDVKTEYVLWSRSAALSSIRSNDKYYFLEHFLYRRVNQGDTIRDALDACGIQKLAYKFEENEINILDEITDTNQELIQQIVCDNWNEIFEGISKQKQYMKKYIAEKIGVAKSIGIVDLGFSGKNSAVLASLIEEIGIDRANISQYMLGNCLLKNNSELVLNRTFQVYMFDSTCNFDARNMIVKAHEYGCGIFEKMFCAAHPSFKGFDEYGNMMFSATEQENNSMIKEIQNGIFEFCRQYGEICKKYPEFLQISGADAYRPINVLLLNRNYVNGIIGKMTHTLRVSDKQPKKIVEFN